MPGAERQVDQETYDAVVKAIVRTAYRMGSRDQRTVEACLFRAGVLPGNFRPPAEILGDDWNA